MWAAVCIHGHKLYSSVSQTCSCNEALCVEVLRMPWIIILTVCSEMHTRTDIISSPLPPSESLQKLKLQRLAEYLPDLKFLTRKLRKVFAMNKKFHFLSDEEKKTNNEKMVSYRTARF